MVDYFTPTVIEPPLPLADITPLERLVLGAIFETEKTEMACLHCPGKVNDCPSLPIAALRDAWVQADGTPSRLHDLVTEQLAKTATDAEAFELDLSVEGYEFILQDIVRRSETLTHVSVTRPSPARNARRRSAAWRPSSQPTKSSANPHTASSKSGSPTPSRDAPPAAPFSFPLNPPALTPRAFRFLETSNEISGPDHRFRRIRDATRHEAPPPHSSGTGHCPP